MHDNHNVLFIYPSLFRISGLPLGLASLAGSLKTAGFNVRVFDTSSYDLTGKTDGETLRSERLSGKRIINEEGLWHIKEPGAVWGDLAALIRQINPLIVGFTVEESNYHIAFALSEFVKNNFPAIPIIAGGVSPTLCPDEVISEKSIDLLCLGEGEHSIVELCSSLSAGESIDGISGIWVKKTDGTIIRNHPLAPRSLEEISFPDFTCFDSALFYKPMQGRLYKMITVETSRGCPYACSYCSAPMLRQFYAIESGQRYLRHVSVERVIENIRHQISIHSPEFIYFCSETFLAMPDGEFDKFIDLYAKIKLPFWFQTRFETLSEDKISKLRDVGMFWMTLGVEHGNETFRAKILNRKYSNEVVIKGAAMLAKLGVGASVNNMIGFPFETRELIFDTIRLNRTIFELNPQLESNVWMFVPFRASALYSVCLREGLVSDKKCGFSRTNEIDDESLLLFPAAHKQMLKGLMKTFNLYVKLPESMWPEVKIAEGDDEVAVRTFARLVKLAAEYAAKG